MLPWPYVCLKPLKPVCLDRREVPVVDPAAARQVVAAAVVVCCPRCSGAAAAVLRADQVVVATAVPAEDPAGAIVQSQADQAAAATLAKVHPADQVVPLVLARAQAAVVVPVPAAVQAVAE